MPTYKNISIIMATHNSLNLMSKISAFHAGEKTLDQAVKFDITNPGIRFLGYCLHTQLAAILEYSANRCEDNKLMLTQWKMAKDEGHRQRIKTYLLAYGNCTVKEKVLKK